MGKMKKRVVTIPVLAWMLTIGICLKPSVCLFLVADTH